MTIYQFLPFKFIKKKKRQNWPSASILPKVKLTGVNLKRCDDNQTFLLKEININIIFNPGLNFYKHVL